MTRSAPTNKTVEHGFTLVELMIALVLSSVIFVNAYQVISNLVHYRIRADKVNLARQDMLLTTNLLSQIIEKGISQNDLFYRADKTQLFRGEGDSLQILSRAYSENFDSPGYRVFRIFRRKGELYAGYQKYDENFQANAQNGISSGIKLEKIRFEYFTEGQWVTQWQNEKSIPSLIKVTVMLKPQQAFSFIRATGRG